MRLESAVAFPGGHGAAQLIGLTWLVACSDYSELHDLFLEKGNAEGAIEHFAQLVG
ncbi:hypothetical protein NB705_003742 [Xanthomonas sacchari]|nr:hypothetical protein [Xanthomonas sacchari]